MKKIFLMLCASMFTASMFAGVKIKEKPQTQTQVPESITYVDTDGLLVIEDEDVPL